MSAAASEKAERLSGSFNVLKNKLNLFLKFAKFFKQIEKVKDKASEYSASAKTKASEFGSSKFLEFFSFFFSTFFLQFFC